MLFGLWLRLFSNFISERFRDLEDLAKLIGALGENADKLGALGLLLLVNIAFLWALAKDKLVTGNRFRERTERDAKDNEELEAALKAANAELAMVKDALLRLQVEKDLLWSNQPSRRTRRATT